MPENSKVLVFIKGLDLGGHSGGADLFGANLAYELHKNEVEVILCICYKFKTDTENDILNSLQRNGIVPFFLLEWTGQPNAKEYLVALRKLNHFLNSHKVDIIHSHFHTGTLLSIMLKLIGKVRWIMRTAHVDQEWRRGWYGIIKQSIIRLLIFVIFPIFIDVEAGVSSNTVEDLNNRFVTKLLSKHTILIHNAVPVLDDFILQMRQKDYGGWQGNHPIVGSVGRLEEQKGYKYLIKALPDLLQQYPRLEIWLIGDGPLLAELKEQSKKLEIDTHIVFWGKQNNVPDLLSKMDVFVSSSLYEGLPTVVLEAMIYGVPCVVTDIPGTRDIADEKNVVLVPSRDCKALASALTYVLCTPSLRKTLTENAVQTVKRFRIENITREYLNIYRKL